MRRTPGSPSAVLEAKATATVPSGNVYLSDGDDVGYKDAQRLILAEDATLTTTVDATANFFPVGSLEVTKTIAGPAAGSQGPVVIHVECTDGKTRSDVSIPAGAPAGETTTTYHDIPAGTMCTVTETADGSNTTTKVVVTGAGQQVTIRSGETEMVHVTNTYHFAPGSLIVTISITGPAAGQQGEIRIHTECNGTALTPDFVIDAGAPNRGLLLSDTTTSPPRRRARLPRPLTGTPVRCRWLSRGAGRWCALELVRSSAPGLRQFARTRARRARGDEDH